MYNKGGLRGQMRLSWWRAGSLTLLPLSETSRASGKRLTKDEGKRAGSPRFLDAEAEVASA